MDASTAARRAARELLEGKPSPGECERAAQLLELAGDGEEAAAAWRQAGSDLESHAGHLLERGEATEAVQALADAAQLFLRGKEPAAARRVALTALSHWEPFVHAKRIDTEPRVSRPAAEQKGPRLRKLPGAKPAAAAAPPPAAAGEAELPSMFLEMHARLLSAAGREKDAEKAYHSLAEAIGREVARRRREQDWQEALDGAHAWLKAALQAGGKAQLDQVRPEFVSLAREAAAQAATPEYFARGHDEVPARAMKDAMLEAHALGNDAFAAKYDAEFALVLERTAEVLDALTGRRLAAEALLANEHQWTMINARPGARQRLVELSDTSDDFVGALGLSGVARTHPLRAEVEEFSQRLEEVVARASARAPQAFAEAAWAALPQDPGRARGLASRGLELRGSGEAPTRRELQRALRAALARLGERGQAVQAHGQVLGSLGPFASEGEAALCRTLEDVRFASESTGGADQAQVVDRARAALAQFLRARGVARFDARDRKGALSDFEAAAQAGDEEALRWTQVLGLSASQ